MEQDTYTRAELIEAMQFVSILTQLCEMHSRYDEAVPAALCNLIKRHFVQGPTVMPLVGWPTICACCLM